jgi:phytoene desaturase
MKVIVVGAGVGGMAAACRLARLGAEVEIFEKNGKAGGRLSNFTEKGFRIDTGPTLLLMPDVLRKFFTDMGRDIGSYLQLAQFDPVYRIYFSDGSVLSPSSDRRKMVEEIGRINPNDAKEYERYLADFGKYYDTAINDFIMKNFDSPADMISAGGIRSLFSGGAMRDLYSKTADYFSDPRVRILFSLQSVYIGAAPNRLPAVYGLIPYIEFTGGVWYPRGGLYAIAEALSGICRELGVKIHTSRPVRRILVRNGAAAGVELDDGEQVGADAVIANSDLPYTYLSLIGREERPHMSDRKVKGLKTSCSAFMIYWGLEGAVDLPHHAFLLPDDFMRTFGDIFDRQKMPHEPGIYVANPALHDPTVAPPGKSVLYVLVPVPNLSAGIDWKTEGGKLRRRVIERLEGIGVRDIEKRIVMERIVTPEDWKLGLNLDLGAAFGLSPILSQSAAFRPHNKDGRIKNLYFVGASTHPGSGIPIVLMSAELIERRFRKDFALGV